MNAVPADDEEQGAQVGAVRRSRTALRRGRAPRGRAGRRACCRPRCRRRGARRSRSRPAGSQRDQQTAGGDERDHVGDAGHQHPAGRRARISPAPPPPSRRAARPCPRRAGRSVVGVAQRLGDHRVGVVDGALDAGGDHRLAGEAAAVAHARRRRRRSRRRRAAMIAGESGVEPAEPWVSTWISTPARSAAASRASAAM